MTHNPDIECVIESIYDTCSLGLLTFKSKAGSGVHPGDPTRLLPQHSPVVGAGLGRPGPLQWKGSDQQVGLVDGVEG